MLDDSRQRAIHAIDGAPTLAVRPLLSPDGAPYAGYAGAAYAASPGHGHPVMAAPASMHGYAPAGAGLVPAAAPEPPVAPPVADPIERAHAMLERAQAVAAQRQTQLAARAAIEARHAQALARYQALKEAGEQRVQAAQRELESVQSDLHRTAEALENAQAVLEERGTKLHDAREKLSTLMSMTRELLRLVKPVTDMRSAAKIAASRADSELAALKDSALAASPTSTARRLLLSSSSSSSSGSATASTDRGSGGLGGASSTADWRSERGADRSDPHDIAELRRATEEVLSGSLHRHAPFTPSLAHPDAVRGPATSSYSSSSASLSSSAAVPHPEDSPTTALGPEGSAMEAAILQRLRHMEDKLAEVGIDTGSRRVVELDRPGPAAAVPAAGKSAARETPTSLASPMSSASDPSSWDELQARLQHWESTFSHGFPSDGSRADDSRLASSASADRVLRA